MRWTIRNKLIFCYGVVVSVFAIAAFIAHRHTRLVTENLTQVTAIATPLKDAAQEMEINLLGMGFAVLGHLHYRDPVFMTRMHDHSDDFVRILGRYQALANTPTLHELGDQANASFARFRELSDGLIQTQDAQIRRSVDAQAIFRSLDEIFKARPLRPVAPGAPPANEKQDSVRNMEASLDELERILLGLHGTFDTDGEAQVRKAVLHFAEQRERYLRTDLAPEERSWMNAVERDFTAGQRNIEGIITLAGVFRQSLEEFVRVRRIMDDLLDDKIQAIVGAGVDAGQKNLFAMLRWMDAVLIAILLGGVVVVGLVVVAVCRGVTGSVDRLRAMTQAMVRDEFVGPEQLVFHDEFGPLTQSFVELVAARKRGDEEIQNLSASLEQRIHQRTIELDHTNGVLEQRNGEAVQITKMSNLLQTASNMDEAGTILSRMLRPLLMPHAGAIYLSTASLNRLDCLTQWGEAQFAGTITPEECWGLRRGAAYGANDPEQDIFCSHLNTAAQRALPYLCVPMMAQGVSLGLVHVGFVPNAGCAEVTDVERLRVQRIADQIALALANIKLRQNLREQSIRDLLTGLYNRRYLEEVLESELAHAARQGWSLAVLMLDVDQFKRYNDKYGHEGGDAVLQALGRVLREMARASDIAARYGGEEFTVVLNNASLSGAREWGERLREAVRKMKVESGGRGLPTVTISLGLALYPEHGMGGDVAELLRAADTALYEAKKSGRDRLVVAAPVAQNPELALAGEEPLPVHTSGHLSPATPGSKSL